MCANGGGFNEPRRPWGKAAVGLAMAERKALTKPLLVVRCGLSSSPLVSLAVEIWVTSFDIGDACRSELRALNGPRSTRVDSIWRQGRRESGR